MGKAHPDFQHYLNACHTARLAETVPPARSVDHKGAGSVVAAQCAGPLAFLVAGHHGGLHDKENLTSRLAEWRGEPRIQIALERVRERVAYQPPVPPRPPEWAMKDPHALDLFLRLLFSCLVDADFLDTEAHFQPRITAARSAPPALADLWDPYAAAMSGLSDTGAGDLARLRHEVLQACLAAGSMAPGLFRLTVPTGGGKTLAGLGFALRHALEHGQTRIIVAVPYTSITEQTATTYRDIFRDLPQAVLEHHSAMTPRPDPDQPDGGPQWERLAAENWDAPLVVTTIVRLFESLFARRTSDCRRLHRITNSVIILDEAQMMPVHLLTPLLNMLQVLSDRCRTSIVFCTATQPALDHAPGFSGLTGVREIAPDPPALFRALRRVRYSWPEKQELRSWAWVAAQMERSTQSLAIVNTKNDAMALLNACAPGTLHLSTLLCGEHRRAVLSGVRSSLKAGEPCRLVTTQVIEAGVDLDFPLVLRAFAPLDRIVQAAGRCNREGLLRDLGELIVFEPESGGMPPGVYKTGANLSATMLLRDEIDPDDPETFLRYFQRLYQNVDLDPKKIQELRAGQRFEEVARQAKVIEDDGVSVIVPYHAGTGDRRVDRLVARLRAVPGVTRGLMRELQPFIVSVRSRAAHGFERDGLLEMLQPGVFWWRSIYDPVRGLTVAQIAPDQLVI